MIDLNTLAKAPASFEKYVSKHRNLPPGVSSMLHGIRNSVHFVNDNGGYILDKGGNSIPNEIRLPFNNITVAMNSNNWGVGDADAFECMLVNMEYVPPQNVAKTEYIGGVSDSGVVIVRAAVCSFEYDMWLVFPCVTVFPTTINTDTKGGWPGVLVLDKPSDSTLLINLDSFNNFLHSHTPPGELMFSIETLSCTVLIEYAEAFACTNVEATTFRKGGMPTYNRQRKKKGKLPKYESKILTIKVPEKKYIHSGSRGGVHNSPRMHLRRGHIRRLRSGKITWVSQCVVGSANKGVVENTYHVKAV